MITIERDKLVNASLDVVWNVVSNMKKETDYWATIRNIRVLSENGNTISREATVGPWAFGMQSKQTMVMDPKKNIKLTVSGIRMNGERTIDLVPRGRPQRRLWLSGV